jgi:hypothetical protein
VEISGAGETASSLEVSEEGRLEPLGVESELEAGLVPDVGRLVMSSEVDGKDSVDSKATSLVSGKEGESVEMEGSGGVKTSRLFSSLCRSRSAIGGGT